jgi:hypothetical protein
VTGFGSGLTLIDTPFAAASNEHLSPSLLSAQCKVRSPRTEICATLGEEDHRPGDQASGSRSILDFGYSGKCRAVP